MTNRNQLRSFAAILLAAASGLAARAGDDPPKPKEDKIERAEGVIIAVVPVETAKESSVRVTVNTAAPWRDYVRDQAKAKPKADGKGGENSIAIKGEPVSPNTTIIVVVNRQTSLANRYRSSTDETSKGSRTVEGAEKTGGSPQGQATKRSPRDEKAPKLLVKDLKVGQFVEVEAKKGRADRLIVLLPVETGLKPKSEEK